ncbi:MAG: hypothetical protein JST46_01675 [Bacteroidetes bacterium]|nr:hypothetical protein [Bacteroidota bacterium]
MEKNQLNEIDLLKLMAEIPSRIKRHFIWFMGTAIFFIFGGLLFYVFFPKQYELSIIGESRIIRSEALAVMASSLNGSARDNNIEDLAKQLHLPQSMASTIVKVKLREVKPDVLIPSTGRENYFELIITVSSTKYSDSLANSFVDYFEKNEQVKLRKQIQHEHNLQIREKIRAEIKHLEQVRDEILAGKMDPKFIMMEPSKLNEAIVEMFKQEKGLDYVLKMENEFQILQESLNPTKPSFPRLGVSLLVGALAGLFIGLLIVLQREE